MRLQIFSKNFAVDFPQERLYYEITLIFEDAKTAANEAYSTLNSAENDKASKHIALDKDFKTYAAKSLSP